MERLLLRLAYVQVITGFLVLPPAQAWEISRPRTQLETPRQKEAGQAQNSLDDVRTGYFAESPSKFSARVLAYPYSSGTSLGQAWDLVTNTAKLASCIDFDTTQDLYQDADLRLSEAIDIDSLDLSLNIALAAKASGSFLGLSAGAEAKTSFDTKFHTKSSDQVFVAHASVVNGATYVSPVHFDPLQLQNPKPTGPGGPVNPPTATPSPSPGAAGASATPNPSPNPPDPQKNAQYLDEIRASKAAGRGTYSEKTLRLTTEFAKLASSSPQLFREKCGDGFVASIVSGADLYVLYHFNNIAREVRVKLQYMTKANAGFGQIFSGSGESSFDTEVKTASDNSQLNIYYTQNGGRIALLPTDRASVAERVKNLTAEARTGPRPIYMVVVPYSDLPSFPQRSLNSDLTLTEKLAQYQKRLISAYFEYLNIRADMNRSPDSLKPGGKPSDPPKPDSDAYMFHSRHGLRAAEENIDVIGDEILVESKEVDTALTALLNCNKQSSAGPSKPNQVVPPKCENFKVPINIDFDDYKYWIRFPVPINAMPKELLDRFDSKDIPEEDRRNFYRDVLFNHWVERISDFRCRVFFECMRSADRAHARQQIADSFDVRRYLNRHLIIIKPPDEGTK